MSNRNNVDTISFVHPLPTWDAEGKAWTARNPVSEGSQPSNRAEFKLLRDVPEHTCDPLDQIEDRTTLGSQFEEQWVMTIQRDVAGKTLAVHCLDQNQQQLLDQFALQNALYTPPQSSKTNHGPDHMRQAVQDKIKAPKDDECPILDTTKLASMSDQARRWRLEDNVNELQTRQLLSRSRSTSAHLLPADAKKRNTRSPFQARSPNVQDAVISAQPKGAKRV